MAIILPFQIGEPGRTRKAGEVACQIVIFPGVRVEYHSRSPAPAPAGKGRPRRRRRSPAKDAALA